jgi:hypothetical protein
MSQQSLINGNWNQTISYQLQQLYELIDNGVITIDQLQDAIASLTATTTVTVIQTTYAPQQTVYIEQTTPLKQPVTVSYQQQVITPQPQTVYLNNSQIKRQVCGLPSPKDEYYVCADAVDKYIKHLKDNNLTAPAQFNCENTGVNDAIAASRAQKKGYIPTKETKRFFYQGIAKVYY